MVAHYAPPQRVAGQNLEGCVLIRTLAEFFMSLTLPCCFTALAAIWSQPWRPPRSTSWGRALLLTFSAERSCYHHKTNCAQCLALPISCLVLQQCVSCPGEGWIVWQFGAASPAPSGLAPLQLFDKTFSNRGKPHWGKDQTLPLWQFVSTRAG